MKGTLLLALMVLTLLLSSGIALGYPGGGIEYNTVRCDGGKCEGTPESDKMVGTDSRDILYAFKGSDLLYGKDGRDDLYGFLGYDDLYGGDGSDELGGGDQRDSLYGNSGSDVLNGGDLADQLQGGDGNDKLFAGSGGTAGGYIENLDGGSGADLLSGGPGFEYYHFYPGWGNDTLSDPDANAVIFHGSQKNLSIGLSPGPGPEATDGTNGVEWGDAFAIRELVGGNADDTITGDDRSNVLAGSGGSDTINGGNGDDLLASGSSPGSFYGSYDLVPDTIDCGPGTDIVFFDPTRDTVTNCENLNP